MTDWLPISLAARLKGCSRTTLYFWTVDGLVRSRKLSPRRREVVWGDVEAVTLRRRGEQRNPRMCGRRRNGVSDETLERCMVVIERILREQTERAALVMELAR